MDLLVKYIFNDKCTWRIILNTWDNCCNSYDALLEIRERKFSVVRICMFSKEFYWQKNVLLKESKIGTGNGDNLSQTRSGNDEDKVLRTSTEKSLGIIIFFLSQLLWRGGLLAIVIACGQNGCRRSWAAYKTNCKLSMPKVLPKNIWPKRVIKLQSIVLDVLR